MNWRLLTRTILHSFVPLGTVALIGLQGIAGAPAAAQTSFNNFLYLPLTGSAAPTNPAPNPNPQPGVTAGSFFFEKGTKNNSADVATDAQGGMHAVYSEYISSLDQPNGLRQVYYTFCTAGTSACANPASWQKVALGDKTIEAQIQVTPAGKPRLLIMTTSGVYNGGRDFYYAECDTNCASADSWTLALAASTWGTSANDILDEDLPQRTFTLDPAGNPRFLIQDRNYFYLEPDHIGAFYMSCDFSCTNPGNWTETLISRELKTQFSYKNEIFDHPSLSFTSNGQPRITTRIFGINEDGSEAPQGLYYLGCDAACTSIENWQRLFLMPTGSGATPSPSWDIDLAGGQNPRIALSTGGGLTPDEANYTLLYLHCDTNCLDSTDAWFMSYVGTGSGNGVIPDIELNAQDQPRIAWLQGNGDLGYAWCNTNCQSDSAGWQVKVVETEAQVKAQNPQAIPFNCDTDTWNGLAPTLSLDSAGNPRIAYDVSVRARCSYDDTPGDPSDPPTVRFEYIWRGVHFTFFAQP